MSGSKLTAATVTTVAYKPSPAGWCAVWHTKLKGFGLRITESGARSYIVKFRLRGSRSTRLRTIGPPTKYTFGEAYEEARKALRDAEGGRDYFETIKRERAQTLGQGLAVLRGGASGRRQHLRAERCGTMASCGKTIVSESSITRPWPISRPKKPATGTDASPGRVPMWRTAPPRPFRRLGTTGSSTVAYPASSRIRLPRST